MGTLAFVFVYALAVLWVIPTLMWEGIIPQPVRWRFVSTLIYTTLMNVLLFIFFWVVNPYFRFYWLSFALPYLYDRPRLSQFFGIRYEDDKTWKTTRKLSRVYIPGIIAQLLRIFIGMDFVLPDDVRKKFEFLQSVHAKKMDMKPYFEQLLGKTITLQEFEDFLSRNVIEETNRVFEVIPKSQCDWLVLHSKALKTIVSALTIDIWDGVKTAVRNFHHVIKMSEILRGAPEFTRILLIAPQLALIHNFSKMIVNKRGNMSEVQPYDFLNPVSRFFVAETIVEEGTPTEYIQLVFVNREFDRTNNTNNRAFGPYGLQCPGALYTFKFIQDVTRFLQALDIKVEGTPIVKGRRFANIVNKDKIFLTFNKGEGWDTVQSKSIDIPSIQIASDKVSI